MVIFVAIAIALFIPVLFLLALRTFDLHKTAKFSRTIVTLICGLVSYLIAAQLNPYIVNELGLTRVELVRYVAPVVEEILKALALIYLVNRADFNYVVDGVLFGFGVGIGFAVIENVEYLQGASLNVVLILAVARVFSTNLMHATSSGLIGTALAYHRGTPDKRLGSLVIAGGYVIAILFHAIFNIMVNMNVLIFFAIGYGAFGAALIWYVVRRGMDAQKSWVSEKLGMEDRVTKEETRAVTRIEHLVETLIQPFKERFGDEKVPLVKELMYKQAEIGIKRKLLEATPSPTKRKEVETIIENLARDMDVLRRQIGLYPMMFVRIVYLDQDYSLWAKLTDRIAESGKGQKGGGVWDMTTSRIKQSKSQEEKLP